LGRFYQRSLVFSMASVGEVDCLEGVRDGSRGRARVFLVENVTVSEVQKEEWKRVWLTLLSHLERSGVQYLLVEVEHKGMGAWRCSFLVLLAEQVPVEEVLDRVSSGCGVKWPGASPPEVEFFLAVYFVMMDSLRGKEGLTLKTPKFLKDDRLA
jgi:hypothetical protein